MYWISAFFSSDLYIFYIQLQVPLIAPHIFFNGVAHVKRSLGIYCFGIVCQTETDAIETGRSRLCDGHFKVAAPHDCRRTQNPDLLAHEKRRLILGAERFKAA